ncbi:MAG: hypothetical protein EBR30_13975 [Cytophagia bacterium]|nr:hypothetical protein [Cytophagia bacterium]NBW36097.1 hypothetical protein [Cytophagia bacterium]
MTVEIINTKAVSHAIVSIPGRSLSRFVFDISVCKSQEIHLKAWLKKYSLEFIGIAKDKIFKGEIIITDLAGKKGEEIFVLKKI